MRLLIVVLLKSLFIFSRNIIVWLNSAGSTCFACFEGIGETASACEGTQCEKASADDDAMHACISPSTGKSKSSKTPADSREVSEKS